MEAQNRKANSAKRGNGYALSRNLTPHLVPVSTLRPLGRATRKHPPQQVRKLAASLERFGFVLPILVDAESRVVDGWALVLAARQRGLTEVPAIRLADLPEAKLRTLRLALNRITDDAAWDTDALAVEFAEVLELAPQIELEASGFETGEIDVLLDGDALDEEDELPPIEDGTPNVSEPGDLWIVGQHLLYCGDALDPNSYEQLLGQDKASMVFADPPYNVPIEGNVSGLGRVKHGNFAMASGELSTAEFEKFLTISLGLAAKHSIDGAVHFVFMDWRHQPELLAAGRIYDELLNMCVWRKTNAGMGSLYRSQHELIYVFKAGKGAHINNVALGRYGRHRSNVWDYPSQNTLNGSRKSKLALHPTVKPVAMIADAIRDCSNRDDLILDPFGGAGTTLIAAERTGRRARLIELNPRYVDASIERWQQLTGRIAYHAATGRSFNREDRNG